MTTCDRDRERLLGAEPDELRGVGETELARHVRECGACSAEARRIDEANRKLDALLSEAPGIDAAALVARARLEAVDGEDAGDPTPNGAAGGRTDRLRPRLRRYATLGAGLAACVAGLLYLAGREPVLPGQPVQAPEPTYALVDPTSAQDIAVFQTDDPDITVLWFF